MLFMTVMATISENFVRMETMLKLKMFGSIVKLYNISLYALDIIQPTGLLTETGRR